MSKHEVEELRAKDRTMQHQSSSSVALTAVERGIGRSSSQIVSQNSVGYCGTSSFTVVLARAAVQRIASLISSSKLAEACIRTVQCSDPIVIIDSGRSLVEVTTSARDADNMMVLRISETIAQEAWSRSSLVGSRHDDV